MSSELEQKYEDLHSDFISQSEAWQKTINEKKVLEGVLAQARQLADEALGLVSLSFQEEWFEIYQILEAIKVLGVLDNDLFSEKVQSKKEAIK